MPHCPYLLVCNNLSQTSTMRHHIHRVAYIERYSNTVIHMVIHIYEYLKRLRVRESPCEKGLYHGAGERETS